MSRAAAIPVESGQAGTTMRGRQPRSADAAASKVSDERADDEESRLIARVKAGDHEAFDALFQRHFPTVYRQAVRLVGAQAEAAGRGGGFPRLLPFVRSIMAWHSRIQVGVPGRDGPP
jgi:hypothetical protein